MEDDDDDQNDREMSHYAQLTTHCDAIDSTCKDIIAACIHASNVCILYKFIVALAKAGMNE